MKKAKLKNITLDNEDADLFNLKDDLLLKAKAIKYSILPKLNILLEETVSRIRTVYGIEVFDSNSIIHSAPNFREKRQNDLKVDYNYAFLGLGASRLAIWEGFKRLDNKPTKIIPYILGYCFDRNGLSIIFDPLRYLLKHTQESNEIFFDFLLKNMKYIQTIQSLSQMNPIVYIRENINIIKPFDEIIENLKKEQFYDLRFIRTIKSPIDYNELNSIITSFIIFYPVYHSLLSLAQNKKSPFDSLISKLYSDKLFKSSFEDEDNNSTIISKAINIDEIKFIRTGIRWQVFERDDFKCVACGKSSHDGAILHVDHIVPRSKGGKDTMSNYQTLCHLCNIGKSNKSDENLRKNNRIGATSPNSTVNASPPLQK